MDVVPSHRALFAVDVVESSGAPGYHLAAIPEAVNVLIDRALGQVDLDPRRDVLDREHTGDGAWLTLSSVYLGALLEVAHALDGLARERNRRRKPEIRLRIAMEVGPVPDAPGLYRPKIVLGRLLDASAFKELFARCLAEGGDSVATGLVVSDRVYHDAFGGAYTKVVRADEFTELPVTHKEFSGTAWAQVPGIDARSLARLAGTPSPSAAAEPKPAEPKPDGQLRVTNHAGGNMSGVQAGIVHGGITFGRSNR